MKRTIVKEGRENSDSETPSGAVTPTITEADGERSDTPQAIDEKRKRSVSDLEKGLNGNEDGTVDVKDEKDDTGKGYVKKN